MNRKSNLENQQQTPSADWFTKHISRRQLGKGLAWTAALSMAGVTIYQLAGGDPEVALDSLELQKKEGWNVGSSDKQLSYTGSIVAEDSRGQRWSAYDPNYLISIYQPRSSEWQPFFVPTLLQSLAQPSLNSQVRPIKTNAMVDAYNRAEGLGNLISQAPDANKTLIISDLPGPSSVALGAAMADTAHLIPVFDNWPHPLGVVRSHETLGAMIYYAHEIEEKRAKLPDNAPAIMLLDNQRLANYTDQDSQFDNRYQAKLPPIDQLKGRGIQQVIYLVPDQAQAQELDDINEDLVEYQKNGLEVRMLKLSEFQPHNEPALATTGTTGDNNAPVVTRYYYGGSPLLHWWFFSHYLYSRPSVLYGYGGYSGGYGYGGRRVIPPPPASARPSFNPPSYRPVTRPTIFSAARVGGATGVGRARPSGFGRTSVRMASNGRVTGIRAGRSGSFGRSGGFFGG
jgi:hypothetical protein